MAAKKKKAVKKVKPAENPIIIDFSDHDYDDLFIIQQQLADHIENRKSQHLDDVRTKLEELAEASHMSVDELQALLGQKRKKAPKYRNPDNAEQTWVGHGRKPAWLQEMLDDGRELEEFLIKKP